MGEGPTRAQVESVRRACKRLAALGRVELRRSHESRSRPLLGMPGYGRQTMERTYLLVRARRTTPDEQRRDVTTERRENP